LYVTADTKSCTEYFEERIKPGLKLSRRLRERWAMVREREHQLYYPDMALVCAWATAKGAFEQRPVDLGLADEVGLWPDWAVEDFRRRFDTRPAGTATLIGISSLNAQRRDATANQPILKEYRDTNQCYFYLLDPSKRNKKNPRYFRLVMGWRDRKSGQESVEGLKWSPDARRKDGTWDIVAVQESAHYVTPWGTIIDDELKNELLLEGSKWIPTNERADPAKWGGHLSSLYLPWRTWGDTAKRFLEACRKKDAQGDKAPLKAFILKDLGEEWLDSVLSIEADIIEERQGQYEKATLMSQSEGVANRAGDTFKDLYAGKKRLVIVTADVQKGYGYWLAREWIENGDSGLLAWGEWHTWKQLDEYAKKVRANRVLVDAGYAQRQQETYMACKEHKFIPTMGRENIKDLLFTVQRINPYEGTRKQGRGRSGRRQMIEIIYFRTDPIKTQLTARIKGETAYAWYVYHNVEHEYRQQVTAEQKIDGDWKAFGPNHVFDMEVLQLLAAERYRFNPLRDGLEAVDAEG